LNKQYFFDLPKKKTKKQKISTYIVQKKNKKTKNFYLHCSENWRGKTRV